MKKLKTISYVNEDVFADEVNKFLVEHEDATVSFPAKGVAYIVYDEIDYEARVREVYERHHITAESQTPVTDEYEREGIRFLCKECPYLERGKDKRRKQWPCKYATYGFSRVDSNACESFYKELKQGLIKPLEVEK